ncbi:hypothetical protein Tco_1399191 [Tanacetum coccineum]
MRWDELNKFCDGTLTSVQRVLHDITSSLEMDYLPKRTWSKLYKKSSRITIKAIDQQPFERRLMRNLEKFVGGKNTEITSDYSNGQYNFVILCPSPYQVVRYRSKSENKEKVPTEMELVLEQTQQGTSSEVSVSTEGVEELKRKVKIKGEKKEALLIHMLLRITQMIVDIED